MVSLDRLTAMSDQHSKQRDGILALLIRLLFGTWRGFTAYDDADQLVGVAARSAMQAQAAGLRARRLERSYVAAQFRELGVPTRGLPEPLAGPLRVNVDPLDVWSRPAGQYIWARRNAQPVEEQRAALTQRLEALAGEEVITAARDETSRLYQSRSEVLGYRRVIHPELSKSGTCGLCIAASQRFYRSGDLMPLHGPSCNCDTLAVTADWDPGLKLNEADLQKIYDAAGSTAAAALQNTRITVDEHGELGPVLTREGDHFRTAEEAGRPTYTRPTPETLAAARTRNLVSARQRLAQVQARYDRYVTDNPGSLTSGGDPDGIRLGLFRSVKNLNDYIRALETATRTT